MDIWTIKRIRKEARTMTWTPAPDGNNAPRILKLLEEGMCAAYEAGQRHAWGERGQKQENKGTSS